MSDRNLDDVIRRLDRLEREVRWWRRGGSLLAILTGAIVLMAQAPPDSPRLVEAERFILRDSLMKIRGEVTVVSGALVFNLYDAGGQVVWKTP